MSLNRGIIEGEHFRLTLLLLNRGLRVLNRFNLLVFSRSWSLLGRDWCRHLAGLGLLRFLRRYSLFMHEYLILKLLRFLQAIARCCLISYLVPYGRLYLNIEFLKFMNRRRAPFFGVGP